MLLTALGARDESVGDVMGDLSLAPRAPAGHRGGRRHDRGQGRGADGGDAHLRPRPARRSPAARASTRWSSCATRRSPPTSRRRSSRRPARRQERRRAPARARERCYPRPPAMARTRDIRTNQLDIACDVCGRTLLRGEHAEHFLAGGARREVCDLCTARAQHEGWIRESGADDLTLRHPRHDGRGRSFLDRLRARRERAREVQDEMAAADEEPAGAARGAAARAPEPPRRPRHVRAVPTNAELKMQRALERLQRLRPHAHGRRRGALARRARASACARGPTGPAWSRSPSCGSCAGTASRSTSPTRPAACGATPRATSCPS